MYKNMTGLLSDCIQNVAESTIFVSLDTTAIMDHVDDVALLQIAVLQTWLEKDVEEARKREGKKTQNISDPSVASSVEEENMNMTPAVAAPRRVQGPPFWPPI